MTPPDLPWHVVRNMDDVPSPALLVYPDRIEENIRRMIRIAGGVERLRPHVKTHKLAEVVRMQMEQGIAKFKCATIAELEMTAGCGAKEALLAYQPVGPNVGRLVQLAKLFPEAKLAAVFDDAGVIRSFSKACVSGGITLDAFLDIDCGMHRTGVTPGPKAIELYRLIGESHGLRAAGLHVYDGHLHNSAVQERTAECEAAFRPANELRRELAHPGLPVPTVIAGGSPTFPIHARRTDVECSPGTCLLWDFGYLSKLQDLDFLPAALVLTRVISKPGPNLLCLDLGHKAIASENPHPRVHLLELTDARPVVHSEEHLAVETPLADKFSVGDCLYGIPWHICPTVALHAEAVVVRQNRAEERWKIASRNRSLTV